MTRKELADRITYTLGLQDDTTFKESDYVLSLIWEGIQDISSRCRVYTRVINLQTTANTQTHDMSAVIIALRAISDGGGRLDRYTTEDIERYQLDGVRGFAWEEPMLWISPITKEPVTLRAFGIFRPQKMTADDDSPGNVNFGGLAPEFHPTVVTYALWKGGEYMQHEGSGNGEKWRLQYEGQDGNGGELAKIRKIIAKRGSPGGPRRSRPDRTVGNVPDVAYWV